MRKRGKVMETNSSYHYTVYADRIIIKYLLVYAFLMIFWGFLIKKKPKWKRLLGCAVIYSASGVGVLFLPSEVRRILSILLDSIEGILFYCYIFGKPTKKQILWIALSFFWSAFYLCGCMTMAIRLVGSLAGSSVRSMCFALFACIFLIWNHLQKDKGIYDVVFSYNGKKYRVKALVDTGNRLYEPITHWPVCILEKSVLEDKVTIDIKEEQEESTGIFMVPFHTVGKKSGMLPAVKVKDILLIDTKESIQLPEMLLGLYEGCLSSRGSYRMLLHTEYLNADVRHLSK